MKSSDIIIIGAGAAGLMAAYGAASAEGRQVTVLEKMPRPGRKIMITGKGRCNFTNLKQWNEFQEHVYPKAQFLRPSFMNLTPAKLVDFFTAQGMESVLERGDRMFPSNHLSSSVVDALVGAAQKAGAKILCGVSVTNVIRDNAGEGYIVNCSDGSSWRCSKLIVTTGGLSYPRTGSTGDGYPWVQALGHKITPRFPSLTALKPKDYSVDKWVSLKNVSLSLVIDGNEAAYEEGDMDFTDGGIEGPIGFKLSRKCVKALTNGSKVKVILDLKPAVSVEQVETRVQALWKEICADRRSEGKPYQTRFNVLLGKLMPQELIPLFLKYNIGVDHKNLSRRMKSWSLDIVGFVGYERCVITAGGVSLDEVDPKTLQSKKAPGLYLAGKILDLDADTGGYNRHIAFCSGLRGGQ
ncbi:MAG: aminoacetone oxidase family FAD-binding enzyme, partial [Bacteroidales bacterium]|nr:aminoacetone oxidase family FAD-binding enzyme [Bacteroidales bacterium]